MSESQFKARLIFRLLIFILFFYSFHTLTATDISIAIPEIRELYYRIYTATEAEEKALDYLKIAGIYSDNEYYDYSDKALEKAVSLAKSSVLKEKIKLLQAANSIFKKKYDVAQLKLLEILTLSESIETKNEAADLLIIVSAYQFDWEIINEISEKYPDFVNCDVDSLLAHQNTKKSIIKAKILSGIFPGSGQLYAGDLRNFINSFAINSLLFWANTDIAIKGDYLSAVLFFSSFTYRFYSGGIYQAGKSAEKYNQQIDNQLKEKLFRLFKNE